MVICHQCVVQCKEIMVRPEYVPDSSNVESNDDDCTSVLLDTKSFIESTKTRNPDMCELHYFIALSTCLSPAESQESRLEAFVKKKWLTKTQCKPPKRIYLEVSQLRIRFIMTKEEDMNKDDRVFQKTPRPHNWPIEQKPGSTGSKNNGNSHIHFQKKHPLEPEDKCYVIQQLQQLLDGIEEEATQKAEQKELTGRHVSQSTREWLRFIMALCHDSLRDKMTAMYRSKSRLELDGRNSEDAATNDYYSSVASLCNTDSWVAVTPVFFGAHTEFRKPIRLVLEDTQIDDNTAKLRFRDLQSRLNQSIANWKRSGNGKGNYNARDVSEKTIRFNGTTYDDDVIEFDGEDNEKDMKFVDDDRFQYCGNRLPTLFFWCMTDLNGLVTFVQSHSKKCGVSSDSGDIQSTRYPGRSSTSGFGPRLRTQGKDALVNAMLDNTREMMHNFQHQQTKSDVKQQIIQLQDQLPLARGDVNKWYVIDSAPENFAKEQTISDICVIISNMVTQETVLNSPVQVSALSWNL